MKKETRTVVYDDQFCRCAEPSKSTLLRTFTKEKGTYREIFSEKDRDGGRYEK